MFKCPLCKSKDDLILKGTSLGGATQIYSVDEYYSICADTVAVICEHCRFDGPAGVFCDSWSLQYGAILNKYPKLSSVEPLHMKLFEEFVLLRKGTACEVWHLPDTFLRIKLSEAGLNALYRMGHSHIFIRLNESDIFWGYGFVKNERIEQTEKEIIKYGHEIALALKESSRYYSREDIKSAFTAIGYNQDDYPTLEWNQFYMLQDVCTDIIQSHQRQREPEDLFLAGNMIDGFSFEGLLRKYFYWDYLEPWLRDFVQNYITSVHRYGTFTMDIWPVITRKQRNSLELILNALAIRIKVRRQQFE